MHYCRVFDFTLDNHKVSVIGTLIAKYSSSADETILGVVRVGSVQILDLLELTSFQLCFVTILTTIAQNLVIDNH